MRETAQQFDMVFRVVARGLDGALPQGGRKCGKLTRKLYDAFKDRPGVVEADPEAGAMGRSALARRCFACPSRCRRAVA